MEYATTFYPIDEESAEFYGDDTRHEKPDLDRMEYELRPHDVQCKICGVMQRATQMFLENQKWTLSRRGEFCPSH